MWFRVGVGELVVVAVLALVALALRVRGRRAWFPTMVAGVALGVAALVTPADPVSMLIFGGLLGAAFAAGARFGSREPVAHA